MERQRTARSIHTHLHPPFSPQQTTRRTCPMPLPPQSTSIKVTHYHLTHVHVLVGRPCGPRLRHEPHVDRHNLRPVHVQSIAAGEPRKVVLDALPRCLP